MNRIQLTDEQVETAMNMLESKLKYRLRQKGMGTFASTHEILGIVAEEYKEVIDAVQNNSLLKTTDELLDLAVGCVFGVACLEAETVDW